MPKMKMSFVLSLIFFISACASIKDITTQAVSEVKSQIQQQDNYQNPSDYQSVFDNTKSKVVLNSTMIDFPEVYLPNKIYKGSDTYLVGKDFKNSLDGFGDEIYYFLHTEVLTTKKNPGVLASDNLYILMFTFTSKVNTVADVDGNKYYLENVNDYQKNLAYSLEGYFSAGLPNYAVSFTKNYLQKHQDKGITIILDTQNNTDKKVRFEIPPYYIKAVIDKVESIKK
ncbi:MAG: hypothetical protein LBG46_05980 [Elusimicrobiota bacterium]|jgi:hypothetical protein|nr:hypothetical protein [Elusimicrobiota bacterium]